jgi:CRP-like cAMP-binding protein
MAILGGGKRSATIVTLERSHLLSLDGNSLRELLMQMPDISFEIFRVLVDRVRAAEERPEDLSSTPTPQRSNW